MFSRVITPYEHDLLLGLFVTQWIASRVNIGIPREFEMRLFNVTRVIIRVITPLTIIKLVNLLRLLTPALTCSGRGEGVIMGVVVTVIRHCGLDIS